MAHLISLQGQKAETARLTFQWRLLQEAEMALLSSQQTAEMAKQAVIAP